MSLLTPTEAPQVHLEILPESAKAARVITADDRIRVSCWAEGDSPMDCDDTSNNADAFLENYCNDCMWYQDSIEQEACGEEVHGAEIVGTYYIRSICPCYQDGLGYVEWPCEEGYTFDDDEELTELSIKHIRYDITLDAHLYSPVKTYIVQQGCLNIGGQVYTTPTFSAVNCFPDTSVCWGDNTDPATLAEMFTVYTESEGNQDLTSFQDHDRYSSKIDAMSEGDYLPDNDALLVDTTKDRPAAIAVASSLADPSAFLLIGGSGGQVTKGASSVIVYYYQNVAVSDDQVCNVWASDVLSTDTRLLFTQVQAGVDEPIVTLFLGQVPSTFNLEPCKSIQPQSSEQEELVNT